MMQNAGIFLELLSYCMVKENVSTIASSFLIPSLVMLPKGVGSNGGKRGVFHHWERFNSREGFTSSHGDTLR
jgi:hypothetical protein